MEVNRSKSAATSGCCVIILTHCTQNSDQVAKINEHESLIGSTVTHGLDNSSSNPVIIDARVLGVLGYLEE